MSGAASPFNPKVVVGLIAASILAFIALLFLLAYADEPGPPGGDAMAGPSRSAVGYAGLVQLAGRFGEARLVRRGVDSESEELLVVALNGRGTAEAILDLLNRRGGRATLLILPKWFTMPDPDRSGWVRVVAPGADGAIAPQLGAGAQSSLVSRGSSILARGRDILAGVDLPVPVNPQVISGERLTPIMVLGNGEAVLARIGDGPHYVLSEPDLVNNHGLREPATARAAMRLLAALSPTGARGIEFDLASGGRGGRREAPGLLQLAFEPPLLAMTLALLFAALLAGYYGAFRFGPARREERAIALGKAALVENSAGLIRLARREARLGGAYAEVIRAEAARITGAPGWLGGEQLDSYLDRLGRPGAPRFTQLAAAMAEASDRGTMMNAARALHEWRRGLVR